MKRNIAIIAGGDSSEYEVSLKSAEGISSFLDKTRYNYYTVLIRGLNWSAYYQGATYPIDRNDFSFTTNEGEKIKTDFAYITIHGTPGENGILQGYFDLIDIPYSTSDVFVEALTFNKFMLNHLLKSFGVKVSNSILLRKGHKHLSNDSIIEKLGLPCFVKPNGGGSSFGITKVKSAEALNSAIQTAMKECPEVMIEQIITGTEVTCGCFKTQKESHVFPLTEVVTEQEFFDYDAKYNGKVDEITPARLTEETTERIQQLTSSIYDQLGCKGIIRIDYILSGEKGNETIFLIEINTTPGMTKTSFIPQQVRAAHLDIKEVMTAIIEDHF